MNLSLLAAIVLAAVAAGGVAYVFLYPLLSGEAKAEKRQRALVGAVPSRRERNVGPINRRDQVAQSLKELEERQKQRNKVTIESRIAHAGLKISKTKFLLFSAALGLMVGFITFVLSENLLMAGVFAFVGFFGMPRWYLGFKKKRRINQFLKELPNAMDIIVRGIRSGLPLGDCMRLIATEAQEPVRTEFRLLVEQQTLGISFADAVSKLYERVPVPEANFFGIVIGIQQKSGGNLAETIGNLSKVLRERKKMKDKIVSMSQEAKASAGIIGSLPFVVGTLTYLTSPEYIAILWTTMSGKMMMAIGLMWMSLGIFVMKKMISFDF
jgi:tight adherence protein B